MSPTLWRGLRVFEVKRPREEGPVRVTSAFNRLLGLPGAWVTDVELIPVR